MRAKAQQEVAAPGPPRYPIYPTAKLRDLWFDSSNAVLSKIKKMRKTRTRSPLLRLTSSARLLRPGRFCGRRFLDPGPVCGVALEVAICPGRAGRSPASGLRCDRQEPANRRFPP